MLKFELGATLIARLTRSRNIFAELSNSINSKQAGSQPTLFYQFVGQAVLSFSYTALMRQS